MVGLDYDYWLRPEDPGACRQYWSECTMKASYPQCRCGTEVDVGAIYLRLCVMLTTLPCRMIRCNRSAGSTAAVMRDGLTLRRIPADLSEQITQVKSGYRFDGERYLRDNTALALNRPAKPRSGRSALVIRPGGAATTEAMASRAGSPVTVMPVEAKLSGLDRSTPGLGTIMCLM